MLSFLNTAVLLGLLAVGLPILIHLFARQKLRRIDFSSTDFLKTIQQQTMRRVRLRQMLLLILRCLAVFFIVLAFARPTLRTQDFFGKGHAQSSVVILLDRSMSMGRNDLFMQAKEKAASVLGFVGEEDEAAINAVPQASDATELVHGGAGLNQKLERIGVLTGRGNISEAVLDASIALSREIHNINQEVFLISDLQATGYEIPDDSTAHESSSCNLFILPVIGEIENVAVVNGGIENRILQPNTPLRIFAELKNWGQNKVSELIVRVFLQGKAMAQKTVTLDPGATHRIDFRIVPEQPGWVWGSIEIKEDDLLADNEYFFTCRIPERIHVLLVGKSPSDMLPLELGLTPHNESNGIFDVRKALHGSDWDVHLDSVNVVFFSNTPSLGAIEADHIRRFLEKGGGLVFLMGDDVDLRNMNEMFFVPMIQMTLGNVLGRSGDGYLTFGAVDFHHPLFRGVFEPGQQNLRSPRISRIVELIEPVPQPIISLRDGHPFFVEHSLGKGKVLICTSSLDAGWSDMAYSTIFAPLITRSSAYLSTRVLSEELGTKINDALYFSMGMHDVSQTFFVQDPEGEETLLIPEIRDGSVELHVREAGKAGIYRFYQGENLLGMKAVNIDPRESNLESLTREALEKHFSEMRVHFIDDHEEIGTVVTRVRRGREIWREMLLAGILMLIAEMIIARESRKA